MLAVIYIHKTTVVEEREKQNKRRIHESELAALLRSLMDNVPPVVHPITNIGAANIGAAIDRLRPSPLE